MSFYLVLSMLSHARQLDFPVLKGPYLGQRPPGMTPEVFAPGIVSSTEFVEFKGSFSPDGNEYYFYRHSLPKTIPTLLFTKVENGVWAEPSQLPIAQRTRTAHPCISHDNKWLFLRNPLQNAPRLAAGIFT